MFSFLAIWDQPKRPQSLHHPTLSLPVSSHSTMPRVESRCRPKKRTQNPAFETLLDANLKSTNVVESTMSATLDPINRSFWFSRMYFAVSVPEGRNSITSWGQEYNYGLFEVFQSCRFAKTMSRTKSYCYPIQRLPQSGHYRRRMRTRL